MSAKNTSPAKPQETSVNLIQPELKGPLSVQEGMKEAVTLGMLSSLALWPNVSDLGKKPDKEDANQSLPNGDKPQPQTMNGEENNNSWTANGANGSEVSGEAKPGNYWQTTENSIRIFYIFLVKSPNSGGKEFQLRCLSRQGIF